MLVDIRRLSVTDYHRLAEVGILEPDEQVELIAGQIFQKMVKNPPHSAANKRIEKLLENCLGNTVLIRSQEPITLNNYSEPEPDIAVVQFDPLYYEDHHPTPDRVYLLIEISDSTLNRDVDIKAQAYGESGIVEYWVVDLNHRQVYRFRQPSAAGYQEKRIFSEDETIVPLAFSQVAIALKTMLPSKK
ncbi:MAG: Uma2 family endonuclease [Cyanothece sp. SIO1E1]|nr:Uma2 family endonuclease [Cyanothece sp. SIO1E1]